MMRKVFLQAILAPLGNTRSTVAGGGPHVSLISNQARSVKYEEVYLKDYTSAWEAEDKLDDFFRFYCDERVHQSLGYRTPGEVYRGAQRASNGG